jgi:hypothetical protein
LENFTSVLSRKPNKSSHRESIANSHSPTSHRNATSHQANSAPKHHARNNGMVTATGAAAFAEGRRWQHQCGCNC